MAFVFDPMTMINLVLCIIILIFGIWGYTKKKNNVPLLIGIGFGLFGVSHLATLLELKTNLETALIAVRTLGYIVVIIALYLNLKQ